MSAKYKTPGVYIHEPATPEQLADWQDVERWQKADGSIPNLIRLAAGESEPEGEDYVQLTRRPSGEFEVRGSVRLRSTDSDTGATRSLAALVTGDGPYPSAPAAETAAFEWAAKQGAQTLYLRAAERG